jgi:TRAP-type transport system periplasmic protein
MDSVRRKLILSMAAAPALAAFGRPVLAATDIKISHQFPGGSATEGDFRDQLCRRFGAELEKRTGGALKGTVYAGSSLMKTNAQFSALRKGALDMSLVPLSPAFLPGYRSTFCSIWCPPGCEPKGWTSRPSVFSP